MSAAQDAVHQAQDAITAGPTDAAGTDVSASPTDATGDTGSAYTAPTIEGSAVSKGLLSMTDGTVDSDAHQIDYDRWWDILGEFIESEEDTELANAQLDKIKTYNQNIDIMVEAKAKELAVDYYKKLHG